MDKLSVETSCQYLNESLPYESCGAMLLIEMDGSDSERVDADAELVGDLCMEKGAIEVYMADNRTTQERVWSVRRNIAEAFKVKCPIQSLEDIVVPTASIPDIIPELDRISSKYGISIPCYGHAGDGNLHATLVKDPAMSMEAWKAAEPKALEELYAVVTKLGGKISGEHGIGPEAEKVHGRVHEPRRDGPHQGDKEGLGSQRHHESRQAFRPGLKIRGAIRALEAGMKIEIPFETGPVAAELPDGSDVLRMRECRPLAEPGEAIRAALAAPIGSEPLAEIARRARGSRDEAKACVVVSDKTRPVPYRGPDGLLLPILETLRAQGFASRDITILVACGMHSGMNREELERMLRAGTLRPRRRRRQPRPAADASSLVRVGVTARGTEALVNRLYVGADLKILTGLVESHFMAVRLGRPQIHLPWPPGRGRHPRFPRPRPHVPSQHERPSHRGKSRPRGIARRG